MYRQQAYEQHLDDDLDAYEDALPDDRDVDEDELGARADRLSHDELIEEARRVREEVDALVGMYQRAVGGGSRPRRPRRRARPPMASRRSARELFERDLLDVDHDDRRRKALLVMLLMDLL